MMSLGLHLRIIGRPGRIWALQQFFEHVRNHKDIWVTTRQQIAATFRESSSGMNLRLERDGPIGRILIDRPDKRNAFNQEMWEQFPVLLGAALIDRAIRVVVVQSATKGVFCAGARISAS